MNLPKSLLEAVRYFSDLAVCHEYMRRIKWPDGKVCCTQCGNESVRELATRPGTLKCNAKACQKQFSYKVGTIFESSPLGLDKWFVAIWSIANCKNGISSHELSRALGVTQKTAWFMLHRIREAMKTGTFRKLDGEKETDSMAAKKQASGRPAGWQKFDRLTRRLIQIPKEEVDAQIESGRKQRKANRRKKK